MTSVDSKILLDQSDSWQNLQNLSLQMNQTSLSSLFEQDSERATTLSLEQCSLYLDYSKHLINEDILQALKALANSCDLDGAIKRIFDGQHVNTTEDRPAWHSALRTAVSDQKHTLPKAMTQEIDACFLKMEHWVDSLNGAYLGATGKPIQDIIHIGIGGSDLGPRFLLDALKSSHQSNIRVHFVANIDPEELLDVLAQCSPESTMFILASKSFSTQETLENGALAKKWLTSAIPEDSLHQHFLAITSNIGAAKEWGIIEEHILPMWDWVGGRYSIWSSMALPVAIKIGMENFYDFLKGGHEMDVHFANAPFLENMPVLLALIGIWYNNFLKYPTTAILPYSHRLKFFPDYLAQLDMESNGKGVQLSGVEVGYKTGPILWGQAGTNGQHAFYQLLHQGTHKVPADFILVAKPNSNQYRQHDLLLAHGVAQTQALMLGQQQAGNPFSSIAGNKPSSTLLLKELNAKTLGSLIALYEHKVYAQGVIWNINSFDQPGVQLGKTLANNLYQSLTSDKGEQLDTSSEALLKMIRTYQEEKNPA